MLHYYNQLSFFAQSFTREIKVTSPRMHGNDVIQVQKMLLAMGFDVVGEADGYFGQVFGEIDGTSILQVFSAAIIIFTQ